MTGCGDHLASPVVPGAEPPPPMPPAGRVPPVDILDTDAAGPTAIRGGVLRSASFVAGLLLPLASAPLLIRHLGDAEFGRYSAVLAVVAVVAGLTEAGVNTISLRELSALKEPDQRDRMMSDLLGLRLVSSAVGVGIAVGFSSIAGYGPELVAGTLLAGLGMVALVTQTLIATVLQSRLRFGWAAAIELLRQSLSTGLIVALVVLGARTLPFLAATVPAGLVALVLTAALVRGTTSLRPAFHPRRWTPLLRDTFVFAIAVAVNSLYFRVTLVILSLVVTAAETGYFAVSFRVIEVLIVVPTFLLGAAFPILSRSARFDRRRFELSTQRLFELALFAGVLMSLCLLLVAPFAIELLVGRDDHPSVPVLQIQSAALIASFVASATGYPLLSLRRHRETLIANCVSLVAAVALALALAPALGARGAAIAAVVADFALAITNAGLLMRDGGPSLPLKAVPVSLVAGICGYAAGVLVGVHPLIEAAVGAAVFLILLACLGRFPPEVRELLERRGAAIATP